VSVNLYEPLVAGETVRFTLTTNVAEMIYEDTPDRWGMEFKPSWFPVTVLDLRVLIVLPAGVTLEEIETGLEYYDNWLPGERASIYWERQNLSPNQQYKFGVSFPKKYMPNYKPRPTGLALFFRQYWIPLLILGFSIALVGVVAVFRKRPYLKPKISIETLGIRRGLTAVEAGYLLGFEPTKTVTEILYSLLHKRAVWAESTTPKLKLRILKPFQDKTGIKETPLRYYEIDFLNAMKGDGTLDEERLAKTVVFLRSTVEEKLRGYCRLDTENYYKKVVDKAWKQVEKAGTPELTSKAYDEQLLWLFLDPDYKTRTSTAFRETAFEPNPLWFWYWYSYSYYHPKPDYKPNIKAPTDALKPPKIPGSEFAHNIATALERTSNKIVSNIEKFANAILPRPAKRSSRQPAHRRSSCVCACAACACVCACVSCACACAGGGVG
jgi:hypothetical protein